MCWHRTYAHSKLEEETHNVTFDQDTIYDVKAIRLLPGDYQ